MGGEEDEEEEEQKRICERGGGQRRMREGRDGEKEGDTCTCKCVITNRIGS